MALRISTEAKSPEIRPVNTLDWRFWRTNLWIWSWRHTNSWTCIHRPEEIALWIRS